MRGCLEIMNREQKMLPAKKGGRTEVLPPFPGDWKGLQLDAAGGLIIDDIIGLLLLGLDIQPDGLDG